MSWDGFSTLFLAGGVVKVNIFYVDMKVALYVDRK